MRRWHLNPWPHRFFRTLALASVAALLAICLFLVFQSTHALLDLPPRSWLALEWNPAAKGDPQWGVAGLLWSTLLITVLASAIAFPAGLGIAIFLSEVAPAWLRELLKPLIEMIASIPSVVLGLIGLLWLAPLLGLTALHAGILVGLTALPTVASLSEDALHGVPHAYRQASWALGAGKLSTILRTVLPAATSGLAAAALLGLGRIIGETIIVLMVAGNARALPKTWFEPAKPITAAIVSEVKETTANSLHWSSLFALGLLLFAITFLLNAMADRLIERGEA